jgi:hypothetical protein
MLREGPRAGKPNSGLANVDAFDFRALIQAFELRKAFGNNQAMGLVKVVGTPWRGRLSGRFLMNFLHNLAENGIRFNHSMARVIIE